MKWQFEREAQALGYRNIIGIDEAGRGPIAGPVVVVACLLPISFSIEGIDDSKKLSRAQREQVYHRMISCDDVFFSSVVVDHDMIDRVNILQATLWGMQEAACRLHPQADYALIDGNHIPNMKIPCRALIKGDSLSYSIGAASIIAKVQRDAMMLQYHDMWPEYDFARHKGYPTAQHLQVLQRIGPCPIHRKSFSPVQRCL